MLFPPTKVIPPDVMFVVTPAVLPEEICSELKTVELFVAATVIVLALELREIPAPATIDNAPVDPFRAETLFSALLEALIVRVRDPAPEALANEMLFPPTTAKLTAVPVTLVPPPLNDCVAAAPAPPLAPITEMLCPFCDRVILLPPIHTPVPVETSEVAPAVFPVMEICGPMYTLGLFNGMKT